MKGHVRQRGQSLEVRVHVGSGKYVTETIRWQGSKRATKDAADRRLRTLLDELDAGGFGGPDATVAQLVARWLRHAEADWSPTTRAARESYLRLHILPALGERKVREVRTADIDDLYAALRAKGLAPSTIRRSVHVIVRTVFGEAVRWRWISSNPAVNAQPGKRGLDVPDLHPPTGDEVRALLARARSRKDGLAFYAFVAVAADTGARRGEVCGLRWSKVDLDAGEVLIDRAVVLDGGRPVEKDTKSHQARRVALGAECARILGEHRRRALESAMAAGVRLDDGYVFSLDVDGARPWRPDGATSRFMTLRERFCDCVDESGRRVKPEECTVAAHQAMRRVRLHDLRHALVTDWLAAGEDQRTVMGRVGHSSLDVLTRYAHFVKAKDRAGADRHGDRIAT